MRLVLGYGWCLGAERYAVRYARERAIYMHREIMGLADDDPREPDHHNGDGLDNRRSNLRVGTHAQNGANQRKQRGNHSSRYIGVSFDSARGKWAAKIRANGKTRNLGRFDTEEEAVVVRDKAALETRGEFARLNILPPKTRRRLVDVLR
jgi:hypothetical protein